MRYVARRAVQHALSRVVRVRTRATLVEIGQFVMRGAAKAGLPSPGHVIAELIRDPAAEHVGVFVGFWGREPRGIVVGHLPTSAFHLAPMITLAYSEGCGRLLAVEMGRRLREWIMAAGFDCAITSNLHHDDRAFLRWGGHFGKASTIGSDVRFDFKEVS